MPHEMKGQRSIMEKQKAKESTGKAQLSHQFLE